MSAAAALARAEAAGVRLRLLPDGSVRLTSEAPPPPEVLADLRRWRGEVACLVALRDGIMAPASAPPPVRDWRNLPFGAQRGKAFAVARLEAGACFSCAGHRRWCEPDEDGPGLCITCHPPLPGSRFHEVTT